MSNTRYLRHQDEIKIMVNDEGSLILSQSSPNFETQIINVSPLLVDEFINQLKLTIAGE